MNTEVKTIKKRQIHRNTTPAYLAKYQSTKLAHGNNGSEAIRILEGKTDSADIRRRAWLLNSKLKQLDANDYIESKINKIGLEAIERIEELVQSPDERIATKNSHFIVEHIRGKAIQRSESKHLNLNIESVLE